MDFQATVNNEGAAEHQKDEGVDDRREERRKEQLLGHKGMTIYQGGGNAPAGSRVTCGQHRTSWRCHR
jgi:hypothetical protein